MQTNQQLLHQLNYLLSSMVVVLCLGYLTVPVVQAGIHFSEIYASPIKGESEWYELYNDSESDLDISHYQLAKAGVKIKKQPLNKNSPIPLIIPAKSYLVLESSIILPNAGSTLYLYNHRQELIEEITYPHLKSGQSYASLPMQNPTWQITTLLTPGKSNQSIIYQPSGEPTGSQSATAKEKSPTNSSSSTPTASGSGTLANNHSPANWQALTQQLTTCQQDLKQARQASKSVSSKQTKPKLTKPKPNIVLTEKKPITKKSKVNKTTTPKLTLQSTPQSMLSSQLALNPVRAEQIATAEQTKENKTIENGKRQQKHPTAHEKKLPLPVLMIEAEQTPPQEKIGSASAIDLITKTNLVTKKEPPIIESTSKAPTPIVGIIGLTAIISGVIIYRLKHQINNLPNDEQNFFSIEET